jgi:hypothetical protein
MKTDLKKVILSNLESLIEKMKHNEGISIAITQRLTFEKWLQIELAGRLNYHLKYETDIKVVLEAPITSKMSKRAKSVDISIQRNNDKLFGIELKIVATNYQVDGIEYKSKGATGKVSELIVDLKKAKEDGYKEYMSLAFVFPFPVQENHRNNARDFPKYLTKLSEYGEVQCIKFNFHSNFNVAFVSLYDKIV